MNRGVDQVLDRVDDRDRVIGLVRRNEVFRKRANFRVAHLLLYNRRSQVLLQQLARGRKRQPGRWGSSVAAYVSAGEGYADAIRRRAKEELGVEVRALTHLGTTRMDEESGCRKFIGVFAARWDGELKIDRSHIEKVRTAGRDEVLEECRSEPSRFTPTFLHLAERYVAAAR